MGNPKDGGFSNQRPEQAAEAALAAAEQQQPEPLQAASSPQQAEVGSSDAAGQLSSSSATATELPAVSRAQVLGACTQVSLLIGVMGLGLHELAPLVSPAALLEGQGNAVRALLEWPSTPSLPQVGTALAAAAGVTATRAALLAAWPAFREASERSNQQTLSPLSPPDLLLVSALPGVAEELLFRGALIPAIAPDWRGAAIASLVFGALHSSGGRNAAFAAWASAVGGVYGALFLATGSLWVPAIAHSAANLASAALWKARHSCIW